MIGRATPKLVPEEIKPGVLAPTDLTETLHHIVIHAINVMLEVIKILTLLMHL